MKQKLLEKIKNKEIKDKGVGNICCGLFFYVYGRIRKLAARQHVSSGCSE